MTTANDAKVTLLPDHFADAVTAAVAAGGWGSDIPEAASGGDAVVPRALIIGALLAPRPADPFPAGDLSPWWDTVESTLGAVFDQLRTIPSMAERGGGRVVLVADERGISGEAGRSAESAIGAAVVAMTKSLAREFGPRAVTTNAVAVHADSLWAPGDTAYHTQTARLIAFLSDDGLPHLTGQIIPCNRARIRTRT